MANEEHLKKLREGVQSWNKWRESNPSVKPNLNNAKLTSLNFSSADLSMSDLVGARLSGARLNLVKLNRANLAYADLHETDLCEADISEAVLGMANLNLAKLSKAVLIGARFGMASLCEADLSGANLSRAKFNQAKLIRADLSNANLGCADLSGANLSGANLSGTNLDGAKLISADLSSANFSRANFSGANLSSANFDGSNLSGANFISSNLSKMRSLGTNFTGANLTGAYLENWKIDSGTILDNIICEYFYYREGHRYPEIGFCDLNEFIKICKYRLNIGLNYVFRDFTPEIGRTIRMSEEKENTNQTNSGVVNDFRRNLNITGGNFIINGAGALSLGDISGTLANTINQLPSTSEPGKPGIKELLEQLKIAIESESNLSDEDKADALEHVQTLAEVGQKPQEVAVRKPAKVAIQALKGIFSSLPDLAKLAETGKTLIPLISHIFGL